MSRAESRKVQILKAAEKVFARKGFPEATISDVAREAKVSEATIYEYFASKEELLFSIPGETTQKGNEILAFHLNYVRGAANKLRSIIYHYLMFYQDQEDYASVIMLILKSNRNFIDTTAYQTVREGYRLILKVIEEGVASGEFKPDLNPYLIRSVILGTMEHLVTSRLMRGRWENLLDQVDPLTDLIIEGIKKDAKSRTWDLRITMEPSGEDK
ncbi:MAG: TetR/AcrR family transcriptional regulator [Pseudomonadota bacterium]